MVSKALTVHCDICAKWSQGREDQPLTEIRKQLKREGWTQDRSTLLHGRAQDLCPTCTRDMKGTQ